jgi:two-component system sensor histidine kinase KdpD
LSKKRIKNIIFSFCILCSTLLICEVLYHYDMGYQDINIIMSLAIFIITAVTDEYIYGLFSAVVGILIYDYLITSPRFGFSFTSYFPVTLIILLLVVFVSSTITNKIKRQAERARLACCHAELLYSINRKLLSTRDVQTIVKYSMDYLKDELNHSVAFFETIPPEGKLIPFFNFMKEDVDITYFTREKSYSLVRLAASSQAILEDEEYGYFFPISAQNTIYGVFVLSFADSDLYKKKQQFINLIGEQTAQALRVYHLTEEQQKTKVLVETEKVKNAFLRSISHDLRTPLTGIIGSSSTLLEEENMLSFDRRRKLIEGINNDSRWLLNMIENILSITRVRQNDMLIEKVDEIVEEVIAEAVSTFRKRFPGAGISVIHPEKMIIVPMDIMLITQVLNNLLENTQRHANGKQAEVIIEIRETENMVSFLVSDTGPGVDPQILSMLYDDNVKTDKGFSSNHGIGLSICKSIICAHGGKICGENRPEGGAQIMFTLPNPQGEV